MTDEFLDEVLDSLWQDFQLEHTYNTLESQQANRKRSFSLAKKQILDKWEAEKREAIHQLLNAMPKINEKWLSYTGTKSYLEFALELTTPVHLHADHTTPEGE